MSREKTSRNQAIFALSKAGGGTMSYRELARDFNVKSVKTIYRIVHRVQDTKIVPKKKRR